MGYNICIEAAGTPVLAYHEDGSYEGTWLAYTAAGFYTGNYGSCSGCDWREGELSEVNYDDRESATRKIDAAIGREILKADPLSLPALLAKIPDMWLDDRAAVEAWAIAAVGAKP